MSSRSPRRPDRLAVRVAAILLVMIVVQGFGVLPAAAAVPLPVIAVLPGGEQTSVVVDLGAGTGTTTNRTATVTVGGTPQPAQLVPVVSDLLTVSFVIDTSTNGAAALPAWLSAAARFILETPGQTQAAVVADKAPPALIAPPQRGALGIVRALNGVRAGGQRSTSDALTLAMKQFPSGPTGRRVVVMYTTAPGAAGESAAALGARFRQAGTILIVVGSAGGGTYWFDAARATGGFFAPAGSPAVVPALDQVETTLRGRYLVQFPTPPLLPARVSVKVTAGDLALTGDVVVPVANSGAPRSGSNFPIGVALATIAASLLILIAALMMRGRRSARPRPAGPGQPIPEKDGPVLEKDGPVPDQDGPVPGRNGPVSATDGLVSAKDGPVPAKDGPVPAKDGPVPPKPIRVVARGRASVPGPIARGRASVPGGGPPPSSPS
jgi:hypothetical protein